MALRPGNIDPCSGRYLYNERPTWLQMAHAKLDTAVLAAYGWPDNLADDELLERLLALNLSRPPA